MEQGGTDDADEAAKYGLWESVTWWYQHLAEFTLEWELPHLEYRDMGKDDPNFPCGVRETGPEYGYRILIEESQQEIVQKLTELKVAIEGGNRKDPGSLFPGKTGGTTGATIGAF